MFNVFTGSGVPPELYPPPSDQRADVLGIKQRLAELLTEEQGQSYWKSLGSFLKGKTDRSEFEAEAQHLLSSEKLVGHHNALILSILYNASRPEPPSDKSYDLPSRYTPGEGWLKRKRVPPKSPPLKPKVKKEDRDPKRRKLKEAIMALGQRERNRLKQLANMKEKEAEQYHRQNQATLNKLLPTNFLCREKMDSVTNTPLASKMKSLSSTLHLDYKRCQQAPLCAEAKQLPDLATLKDRMSLIAYDHGLLNGVDPSVTSLALIALEVHLKTLLGDLLSLIRSDRSVVNKDSPSSQTSGTLPQPSNSHATQTSIISNAATPHSPHLFSKPAQPVHPHEHSPLPEASNQPSKSMLSSLSNQAYQSGSNLRLRDLKTQGLAPHLTARDFSAFAEISPHAFVRSHPGAMERLLSSQKCSDLNSSDEDEGATTFDVDVRNSNCTGRKETELQSCNWMSGLHASSSVLGTSGVGRPLGVKNALGPNSSTSRLSRTNSFSPRSYGKTTGRGGIGRYHPPPGECISPRVPVDSSNARRSHHDYNAAAKLLNPDFGTSIRFPSGTLSDSRVPSAGRLSLHLNSSASQSHPSCSNATEASYHSPVTTCGSSANGLNGLSNSPVLEQRSIINSGRRSSSSHPVKSLAAELFPEDDATNLRELLSIKRNYESLESKRKELHLQREDQSGSESENEDEDHTNESSKMRLSNGKGTAQRTDQTVALSESQSDCLDGRPPHLNGLKNLKLNGANCFRGSHLSPTLPNSSKRKGWERIDTFQLLENVGN